MALKNLFDMVKADRYTQDGREELIKAQEECTEDVKYNNGDISQKTGLMKTPNGWVEPPKGKVAGKKAVEAKGKEVQRQMKHDDLVSRMAEEERIWNKNHPDKAHYNYNPKPTEKKTESKPAAKEPKLKEGVMNSRKAKAFKPELEEIRKADPSRFRENLMDVLSSWSNQNESYLKNRSLMELMNLYDYERNQMYETGPLYGKVGDSAPRTLTGDTRIRVRKA